MATARAPAATVHAVVVLSGLRVALLGPTDHSAVMVALLALEPVPLLFRRYHPGIVMAVVMVGDLALAGWDPA